MSKRDQSEELDGPKLFQSVWVPEPEPREQWLVTSLDLAMALNNYRKSNNDPLVLAKGLRNLSLYGHEDLGTEIYNAICTLKPRKRDRDYENIRHRDQKILIDLALKNSADRDQLLQKRNEALVKSGRDPIDPKKFGKIEIENAVMALFDDASDAVAGSSSAKASADKHRKREQRRKDRIKRHSAKP